MKEISIKRVIPDYMSTQAIWDAIRNMFNEMRYRVFSFDSSDYEWVMPNKTFDELCVDFYNCDRVNMKILDIDVNTFNYTGTTIIELRTKKKTIKSAQEAVNLLHMLGGVRPQIKNVLYKDPATIVFWTDGTKTVVKCQERDAYNPEVGLVMAYFKKCHGNNGSYYEEIKKWLPEEKYCIGCKHILIPLCFDPCASCKRYSGDTRKMDYYEAN